jgi:hypothetical protein
MSTQDKAAPDWRKLALQFDGQRMAARVHLRLLLEHPDQHAEAARKFLAASPSEQIASTQQAEACTCPSGDGSLRWPCPVHAAQQAEPAQSAVPMTREQEIAIKEGERIAASDRYFGARAFMLDTAANRRLFDAGFDAAWGVKLDKEA